MPGAPQETDQWYVGVELNSLVKSMPEIYLEKIAALLQYFVT